MGPRQIIQVPSNGLRDGNMGDDIHSNSAEESLQINLLSCAHIHTPLSYCD